MSISPYVLCELDGSGGAETLFGGVKEHEVPLDGSKIGEYENSLFGAFGVSPWKE